MSNATNVTYAVNVVERQVSPQLSLTTPQSSDASSIVFIYPYGAGVHLYNSVDNTTKVTKIVPSGVKSKDGSYLFAQNLSDVYSNILSEYYVINDVGSQTIGEASDLSFKTNNYDFNLLPIISINGFAIISFDQWWSMFKFPSNSPSILVTNTKLAFQKLYPPMLNLGDDSPLKAVVTQLQSDIMSGVTQINNIIDTLSSISISGKLLDPNKIIPTRIQRSVPIGNTIAEFSIEKTTGLLTGNTSLLEWNNIQDIFEGQLNYTSSDPMLFTVTDGITFPAASVLPPGSWVNGAAKISQPSLSQFQGYLNTYGKGSIIPTLNGNVSTIGDFFSGVFSYLSSGDSSAQYNVSCSPMIEPSSGWSLFNPAWWTGYTPGTEWALEGNSTINPAGQGVIHNSVTPFIFPYYYQAFSGFPGNISDWYNTEVSLCTVKWGIVLLNQGNTGSSVMWNIPNQINWLLNQVYDNSNSSLWTTQFSALGYTLNYSTGNVTSTSGDAPAYSAKLKITDPDNLIQFGTISSAYASYIQHNFTIDLNSSLKEIVHDIDDPFEAIADKVLALRDEFNAKVLSDINCKVMNFPTIENAISNYQSVITYFNTSPTTKVPATVNLYTALAPIFIGALNLGTYYTLIEDLYQFWPFSSIPSSVLLAWQNIQNTYKWSLDFPWTSNQLSMLVNWLFLVPSPTSLKATSTQVQYYKLNSQYHIFTTSEKPVQRSVPMHKLTMLATDAVTFDPSVNEVKHTMDALEDISTCLLACSTGYTVAKSSESMLNTILKNNNLSSLEEMATSSDPNIKNLYSNFSQWWVQTFHSKSNAVSSQHDDYKSHFFIPKSDNHKRHLAKHMDDLSSIFDAVSLSTFKNSDILGQVSQMSSNTFSKHKTMLISTMGKLGTDVLADDSLKLLDHAIEDVVHNAVNIAVDVGKVILNMVTDILATGADLLSPVSVVTQLYNDLTEHVYNGYSQVPDLNCELFNGSATPNIPWSFSLSTIPNMFKYKSGKLYSNWGPVESSGQLFISGGLAGRDYAPVIKPEVVTVNSSSTVLVPFSKLQWSATYNDDINVPFLSIRDSDLSAGKSLRYRFHTSVGDAFIYVINNLSYSSQQGDTQGYWYSNTGLYDVIVAPEPVKNHLGVIDSLRTVKKMVEVIYQLPRLFGCSGLFDYLYYKDLWRSFISNIGSEAWANDQIHVATNELIAADSAGFGMALGYTAYAAVDGAGFNWSGMIENGIIAATDTAETAIYTNKVSQINSEPNVLSTQSQAIIQQFLAVVMHFIYDWRYMMKGGSLEYLQSHKTHFSSELVNAYSTYCTITYDENEANRHLCQILNDYFYGTVEPQGNPWNVSTLPDLGDFTYDTQMFGIYIDCDSDYRWTDKQISNIQYDSSGSATPMSPVYSPSIFRDFMAVAAGIGRIAAGAFLEKRVAKLFLSHAKLSKKLAYVRAKVKSITAAPWKLSKFLGKTAINKYHREHNSKSRAKLINTQTTQLESTLTTQTNTLAGDISGVGSNMSSITFGLH